jgi:hypothetical protein
MKKFIIILLLLVCTFAIFYNIYTVSIHDVASIYILNNENKIEITTDKYKSFLKIISKSKKNNLNASNELENSKFSTIEFHLKNKKILKYTIFFDFNTKTISYYKDNKLFTLNEGDSKFFFSDKQFSFIYYNSPPKFNIYLDDKLINYNSLSTKINYTKTDNKIYTYNNSLLNNTDSTLLSTTSKLSLNSEMEIINLKIENLNGEIIYEDLLNNNVIFIPDINGEYFYEFNVSWKNKNLGNQVIKYNFIVNNPIKFSFNKDTIAQGNYLTIKVYNAKDNDIIFLDNPFYDNFKFYNENNYLIGYLPINSRVKSGKYNITYGVNNILNDYEVNVLERNFKIQHLYVKQSIMDSTSNDDAYNEYYKYFYPAREISTNSKIYNDNFILPVKGRVTTEYGEYRFINDKITSYSHSGIDIAAPEGTNIKATNSGIVTLSRNLALTGNTIIINHGQGLFSYYQHLDQLFTNSGAEINKGDIIGTVGSTGRSTGAHLHFAISFHNKYIEPGYLIYNEPITKSNYNVLFEK